MTDKLILIPRPKKLDLLQGFYLLMAGDRIVITTEEKEKILPIARRFREEIRGITGVKMEIALGIRGPFRHSFVLQKNKELAEEAYLIIINEQGIKIEYQSAAAAFYATRTIKQLLMQTGKKLQFMSIRDWPDYPARGVLLDISRNKIPKLKTLKQIIDMLADLKINQLQLYIEGAPFAYPSFPKVWANNTPLTGEDILLLDKYCSSLQIELVPNQNSFGHMAEWLAREEFKELAELPDGYDKWGEHWPPGTLNPLDPASLDFVKEMYDDLLPYFSSGLFNVGCDETHELGQGKSREACQIKGSGQVYLDFLLKIYKEVTARGKKMMFWGDIIINYPELISQLPRDVVALEWGYEADHPFEEHGKKFRDSGIPFYVCPGTSSWSSISGRTENMKANILNAAANGLKYGAAGFLITDWGDRGHWQYLPFSYPGFIYGAAISWGLEDNQDMEIAGYLNKMVFQDQNEVLGELLLDLGNYYLQEPGLFGNGTIIVEIMVKRLCNLEVLELAGEQGEMLVVKEYVEGLAERLTYQAMTCPDAALVREEIRNAINLIKHGVNLINLKFMLKEGEKINRELLVELIDELSLIIKNHKELWLARNRLSELHKSTAQWESLKEGYQQLLAGNDPK